MASSPPPSARINRVGHENLYIGGIFALSDRQALQAANITHVVSVLKEPLSSEEFLATVKRYQVPVDDVTDEDILQHIPGAVRFIEDGLRSGGGVLVHCAAGKSRSATICIAYLLSRQAGALTPAEALLMVQKTRPLCEPNEGFMEQLQLFHEMQCPVDVLGHPRYKRWVYEKAVELSVQCGRGPDLQDVRFEDEQMAAPAAANTTTTTTTTTTVTTTTTSSHDDATEIRCRKCRRKLATLPFVIPHQQGSKGDQCAHIFLHPLTWMRPSLFPTHPPNPNEYGYDAANAEAPLSGRLTCPNAVCGANIGKFAWQGMPCSCGTWVVPAIGLAKARVDTIDAAVRAAGSDAAAGAGIRLPPGMKALPTNLVRRPVPAQREGPDSTSARARRGGAL